jgi:curved DNA-binding protein CbpA
MSHAAAPEANKAEEATSPEHQATRMMIQKAAEEMEGRDHYQALGVTDGASSAEIKKAYFRLAKLYHPDRHFDPELNDMKNTLESLFTRITEAYNALNDEAKRKAYDFSRIKTPRKVEFEEDHTDRTGTAANQFNKGLKEYKAGNFWGALEAFGWACRLDPINAKYFYYLGLSLLEMPRRRHEAEESFKKALEMEPSRVDARLALADLYRKGGLKSRALAMLREALQWDPDSAQIKEAMIAVESGGAGGEQEGEKESSGFLGKLFGNKK